MLIAFLVEEMLSSNGYEVVMASDGSQAMELLEQEHHRFFALVTDIKLPKFNGWEVARRARELAPQIPVVYQTGDSWGQWRTNGVPGSALLQKPFNEPQLLSALNGLVSSTTV